MTNLFKNICVSIVLGCFISWLSNCLESSFLQKFLSDNLITLLIALLAVNIATLSIIASNLKEMSDKPGKDFKQSIKEMKMSVMEQIVVIALACISQILIFSKVFQEAFFFSRIEFLLKALPACLLVYAIIILWDTSKAIFSTMKAED